MFKKIIKVIKSPRKLAVYLTENQLFKLLADEPYLKLRYRLKMRKKLDLDNPQTYNEKLQWLKLYNRKEEYTDLVDKYKVRSFISDKIGDQYLIPLLGVYENFDDIDFDALPNQFVLKPNHTSGNVFLCTDKKSIDYVELKEEVNGWLERNYYWLHREWPYKNVKPRIICEEFMEQGAGKVLRDYRFFCFNGNPKFVTVDFDITNKKKTRRNLYNLEWDLMEEEITYPKELSSKVEKPEKFNEMLELSRKLSSDFPHARIDFYYIQEKIYFGEITFFHQSGMGDIRPNEFDEKMGSWIKLPKVKNVE